MKKLTHLWFVILLMIFLGVSTAVEARTGEAGSTSSAKSASKSKPAKASSATNSAFATAAKTKQAKSAWQERNKKIALPSVALPAPSNSTTRQEQRLSAIQKQLAEVKHQQQIIAIAQTAVQLATNKRPSPTPRMESNKPVTNPIENAEPNRPVTNPIENTEPNRRVAHPVVNVAPAESDRTPWLMLFLVLGGVVLVVVWLAKRNNVKKIKTIYRL